MFKSPDKPHPEPEKPSSPGKTPAWAQTWLIAAILALATVALYWPATRHDFINYDDDRYVTANIHVQRGLSAENLLWALSHPVGGNWHPLTVWSHMLDCQLFDLQPGGHHLTSIVLHAVNASLLFILLCRLTGKQWRSAFVAAVFAWHPLHVESVAWVAERKDVLSTCFGLLSLLCYSRHVQLSKAARATVLPAAGSAATFQSPFYWLAWGCFALGLMSKPMLVTWPFVMLLLDCWPLGRLQPGRLQPLLIEKIPFFALAALDCIVTFVVQSHAGATRSVENLTVVMRCVNALMAYGRYLLNLLWPHDLAVYYPFPAQWPLTCVILAAAVLGGLTALFWLGRSRYPALLTGWLWYLGTLVPVIGLVQVGSQSMADRYTYIPSIGVLILAVWLVCDCSRSWPGRALVLSAIGAAVLMLCCDATRQQLAYWQNSETLFSHALNVTADNDVARNNLGVALLAAGQTNSAMTQFQAAVKINPAYYNAHENIGDILAKSGHAGAAISEYQETIRLKPDYAEPHNNLAILLAAKGRPDDAIAQYREAIRLNPEFADAHFNLAQLLAQQGRAADAAREFQAAIQLQPNDLAARQELAQLQNHGASPGPTVDQLQAALQQNPNDAELHFKLGFLLARKDQAGAINEFQTAVRLKPDFAEAHSDLGSLLSAAGRADDAIGQFQEAIRLKPDFRDAHYNLANAFFKSGQLDAAAGQFRIVTQLSPGFAPAHYYLGICRARQGRLDDATAQFQEALRLRPDDAEAATNLARIQALKNGKH